MQKFTSFIISLVLLSSGLLSQEKVYMPYPEVINMHPDYQYSLARLFRTYVIQEGRFDLVLPQAVEGYFAPMSNDDAMAAARQQNAPYFLLAEMNQISDVVIVSFTMYETMTGKKVWADMMRALTPDDLDPILSRMAKSMGTEAKASKKSDIYSVTHYDANPLRQTRSHYNFGVSVGGALPIGAAVDKPFGPGLGIIFSYDSRNLIFDIKGEYYWSEADVYNMSLDLLWPLQASPSTPYLQGGLGIGGIELYRPQQDTTWYYSENIAEDGLMFFLGGGYILNRASDVHLRLGGRVFIPTFTVDGRYMPGLMLNASILFGRR